MADKKYLSKIVKGSDTLWIKDAEAQASIEDIYSKISGGLHYLGKSTTPIADGDATGPWVIDGVTYVVSGAVDPQKNLAAGANPMVLKKGIAKAVDAAVKAIVDNSKAVQGSEDIARVGTVSSAESRLCQTVRIFCRYVRPVLAFLLLGIERN